LEGVDVVKDSKAFLDSKYQMVDLQEARHVEVSVDTTGKLWINVDNVCIMRVGKVRASVIIDTPKVRKEINL